jgi:hypothetical protein
MKSIWTHRRLRLLLAAVATVVTGAALASAALAGIRALDLGPAAANQYPKKVTVCHRTHSKKHPWVKIRISRHALKAHLRHGDFVVDATHPCPPASTASAKTKKQHGKGKHHHAATSKHHDAATSKHHHAATSKPHHGGGKGKK